MAGNDGTKSIRRALKIIRTISNHKGKGVRLGRLAKEADLHVATARRILGALVEEEFVQYDRITKQYNLGLELFTLRFAANQFDISNRFRSAIESIAKHTGETVFLVIRSGNDSLCIDLVEGSAPIRIMPYTVGTRTPLGIGAGSLALIFKLPDSEIKQIINSNALRYSQYNASSKEKVLQAISQSRALGYALSKNLFLDGVGGVGIPVYNRNAQILAAINVASLTEKLDPSYCKIIANLVKKEIELVTGIFNHNRL